MTASPIAGIATITLGSPATRNAFDPRSSDAPIAAFDRIERAPALIRATGPVFCPAASSAR